MATAKAVLGRSVRVTFRLTHGDAEKLARVALERRISQTAVIEAMIRSLPEQADETQQPNKAVNGMNEGDDTETLTMTTKPPVQPMTKHAVQKELCDLFFSADAPTVGDGMYTIAQHAVQHAERLGFARPDASSSNTTGPNPTDPTQAATTDQDALPVVPTLLVVVEALQSVILKYEHLEQQQQALRRAHEKLQSRVAFLEEGAASPASTASDSLEQQPE